MAGKTPRLYLEHIEEAVASMQRYVAGKTFEDFVGDDMLRAEVERRIEIVSEVSRRLPTAMKARYPDLPWHDIAAIGNELRHEYYAIENEVLWRIATEDLRPLAAAVDAFLAEVRDRKA